jgi:hypothetical protein
MKGLPFLIFWVSIAVSKSNLEHVKKEIAPYLYRVNVYTSGSSSRFEIPWFHSISFAVQLTDIRGAGHQLLCPLPVLVDGQSYVPR